MLDGSGLSRIATQSVFNPTLLSQGGRGAQMEVFSVFLRVTRIFLGLFLSGFLTLFSASEKFT
jgi:hypothetical protein